MKTTLKRTFFVPFALLFGLLPLLLTAQEDKPDPILEFYRDRAAGQYKSRHPLEAGLSYSQHVRAYRYRLERGGKEVLTDSADWIDYMSFGHVDSQNVRYSTARKLTQVDLSYPNVFAHDYHFRFFPNDTGGSLLAIGFESDTVKNLSPVGLAIIDRTRYFLRRLYLYYPNEQHYERFSRTISLREQSGFIFPETVITLYSESGIFSLDHYRIDAFVDSVTIHTAITGAPRDSL